MRTITLEEHFTTQALIDAAASMSGSDPSNDSQKMFEADLLDLDERRLATMDSAGIELQVLSMSGAALNLLDMATASKVAHEANDIAAAAVKKHPSRFAAFATLALQDPETAATEFKRCVLDLGFKGALVNGTVNGLFLDDKRFAPLFATAQELDVPIYLHPAPPPPAVKEAYYRNLPGSFGQMLSIAGWGWHVELGLHILRLITAGVFDEFPKLKIIIGHMGEDLPFSIARADYILSRSPMPLSRLPSEVLQSNIYITTSGYFTLPPFQCAMDVVGADRILFSVDFPYSKNAQGRAFLDSLQISTADKEKIAHGNAERLLKL